MPASLGYRPVHADSQSFITRKCLPIHTSLDRVAPGRGGRARPAGGPRARQQNGHAGHWAVMSPQWPLLPASVRHLSATSVVAQPRRLGLCIVLASAACAAATTLVVSGLPTAPRLPLLATRQSCLSGWTVTCRSGRPLTCVLCCRCAAAAGAGHAAHPGRCRDGAGSQRGQWPQLRGPGGGGG
jgi:hypothetical protein